MGEDSKYQVTHILLGAFVVSLTIILFLFSYKSGPKGSAAGYALSAHFNATDGIAVGSDVLLTGIKVGQVSAREYDSKRQTVVVKMTFQNTVKIPDESTLSIVSDGLLGPKYLKVEPGGGDLNMKSGDQFEYVQDAIPLVELLEKIVIEAEQKRKKPSPPVKVKDNPFSLLDK
ncbi:MAG: MlaD family protein [Alphaproteobacteria bacterium]|jgi:phospholipid/cholesterol/gamma-HCH transport system substrate-binding protein